MALNHKDTSKLKVEHVIIAFLLVALIGAVAYFTMQNKGNIATESAPVQEQMANIQADNQAQMQQDTPVRYGMAIGKLKGDIHPIVNILDDLRGFKIDKSVAPEDTVYVIYDPRCPYCTELFQKTEKLDLKAKGITIKWLPTIALGLDSLAEKQAAIGLRAKSVADLSKGFGQNIDTSGIEVSENETDALNENLAFLFEASNQTFGESHGVAVPATFFIDKETGTPNMMYGASDEEIFKQIFGE